jgi:cytochrome c1
MRWIRDPQGVTKGTPMPNLGVSEQEGRDLAAFLYTLK